MQLIVPYAAVRAADARRVASGLELPALRAFIARCAAPLRDDGAADSLSPPHERAIAHAYGWQAADGCLPWAAHAAHEAGIAAGSAAWGLLTPTHWRVGSDEVGLVDPLSLELSDAESRALFDAAEPLVTSAGCGFLRLDALRWLISHDSLRDLPTASIDRAIGRDVERWLPREAKAWSRLHSELQMAWYREPVNDAREARGAWPVNALWLSGCGVHQSALRNALRIDDRLRASALAGDWAAWGEAWNALDAQAIAPLLRDGGTLTLCGEASSATLQSGASGWWPKLRASLRRAEVTPLLESL